MKNTKVKKTKIAGMIVLLVAAILAIAIFGFSCVGGLVPIGWSGGNVSNGILYVGSLEGRLVSVNVTDLSILRAEPLTRPQQTGLFGCSGASSCVGGAAKVPIYGTPVVSEDLVYVAGYNGKIYSYKTSNLAQRWIFPREGYYEPFVGGLVLDQNRLFIGCSDGYVYSIDAATGDLIDKFKTEDKIWGTPAVADNTVYIGSFDKKLYALNTADLSLKWTFSTEGSIISQPLVYNGVVYFGSFDRYFYAVNASDGSLKWKFMAESWFWTQPAVVGDTIYAGCLDSSVYVFEAGTGRLVSKLTLDSQLASKPVIVDNYIFFASHNGIVYKIDTDSHTYTQVLVFESSIDGPLTVYDGIIYIQTSDYALQRIDTSDNSLLPSIPLVIG